MSKIILAVVGLAGSGKTEAVDYLIAKTSWPKVYLGEATFEEMDRQKLEHNPANEQLVREQIREQHGMSAYATLNLPKIDQLFAESSVIVESLYSWEEYLVFRQEFGENFKVLAIYASPGTRTERLANRPVRPLTAAELEERDYKQIENLHQAGPIARADFTIVNEGSTENLHHQIDKIIDELN